MARKTTPAAGRIAGEEPRFPGPMDAATFLRRHWQKRPLLVRGAFPGFRDPLASEEVLRLAGRPEAESRLVRKRSGAWSLAHGPFDPARLARLPGRDWTVLVQDTQHFSREAGRLLDRFAFLPRVRIDDLMVSYAVPGGSVGPHVDSYDVFLIQGMGRRRWQLARPGDEAFVPGLDLRILANFAAEAEWVLEAGDMLYLPPGVPHYGIAETECLTWSVGFRAPADQELAAGFLDHLGEKLALEGRYADPGQGPVAHAGDIPEALVRHVAKVLAAMRWGEAEARAFAGRFLTEPKAHVFLEPPARPLTPERFALAARERGLSLDGKARLAHSRGAFFLNGEPVIAPEACAPWLRRLADRRRLESIARAPRALRELLHAWYREGVVRLEREGKSR
jgi:50S ribosomal protein L16 3-hydroxylase